MSIYNNKDKLAYFKDNVQSSEEQAEFDANQYYYNREVMSTDSMHQHQMHSGERNYHGYSASGGSYGPGGVPGASSMVHQVTQQQPRPSSQHLQPMGRPIGGGGNIVLGMNGDNGQYVGGLSRTSVGGGYGSQQGVVGGNGSLGMYSKGIGELMSSQNSGGQRTEGGLLFDTSNFPVLSTNAGSSRFQQGLQNSSQGRDEDFTILKEDFPALPGSGGSSGVGPQQKGGEGSSLMSGSGMSSSTSQQQQQQQQQLPDRLRDSQDVLGPGGGQQQLSHQMALAMGPGGVNSVNAMGAQISRGGLQGFPIGGPSASVGGGGGGGARPPGPQLMGNGMMSGDSVVVGPGSAGQAPGSGNSGTAGSTAGGLGLAGSGGGGLGNIGGGGGGGAQQASSGGSSRLGLGLEGQSREAKFGLAGLLDVIRMTDRDLNTLALGSDLTTFGLNLNSVDCLFSTFSSPFADHPSTADPQFATPACYLMHPPSLKGEHLSKFQMETLFYMFYAMPRDLLQACAAQELHRRDWRYHSELRLWLKPRTPQELMQSHPNVQFVYFDVGAWETRLFQTAFRGNIATGLLSDEDVRVKSSHPPPGSS